jgi:hypothetical protein
MRVCVGEDTVYDCAFPETVEHVSSAYRERFTSRAHCEIDARKFISTFFAYFAHLFHYGSENKYENEIKSPMECTSPLNESENEADR